jgi:hypothetical protein
MLSAIFMRSKGGAFMVRVSRYFPSSQEILLQGRSYLHVPTSRSAVLPVTIIFEFDIMVVRISAHHAR